jgi:hypothetical protein
MVDPIINPRTGREVTRIVRAKHRELERQVILRRTGELVTIRAHDYNATLHAAPAPELDAEPAKPARKKRAKKKTTRKKKKK